jgi:hypothetical protein
LVSKREEREERGGEELGRWKLGRPCGLKLGCGAHACVREKERPTA